MATSLPHRSPPFDDIDRDTCCLRGEDAVYSSRRSCPFRGTGVSDSDEEVDVAPLQAHRRAVESGPLLSHDQVGDVVSQ